MKEMGVQLGLIFFINQKNITMKSKIAFIILALFSSIGFLRAQGGGYQQRTVEERVKMVMDKLTDLKLNSDQTVKSDSVFTNFFRSTDKLRAGLQPGTRPDRTEIDKLRNDRDDQLKKIFTDDQYKKWKDEIEPAMRQQRGGGGNSGGNNQ